MKNSENRNTNVRSIARIMSIPVLALIMLGMSVMPSLAWDRDDHHGRREYYRHGRHYEHGRYYKRGGYYAVPVYAPPPPVVYTPPPPQPGITFVFPVHIR